MTGPTWIDDDDDDLRFDPAHEHLNGGSMGVWWQRFTGWLEHATHRGYVPPGERPRYGHGRFGRPLWTERDRDAEEIRKVLRRAGLREFTERHAGFAVEGDGRPFYVVAPTGGRGRALAALQAAGYVVSVDLDDDKTLIVWGRGRNGGR